MNQSMFAALIFAMLTGMQSDADSIESPRTVQTERTEDVQSQEDTQKNPPLS